MVDRYGPECRQTQGREWRVTFPSDLNSHTTVSRRTDQYVANNCLPRKRTPNGHEGETGDGRPILVAYRLYQTVYQVYDNFLLVKNDRINRLSETWPHHPLHGTACKDIREPLHVSLVSVQRTGRTSVFRPRERERERRRACVNGCHDNRRARGERRSWNSMDLLSSIALPSTLPWQYGLFTLWSIIKRVKLVMKNKRHER